MVIYSGGFDDATGMDFENDKWVVEADTSYYIVNSASVRIFSITMTIAEDVEDGE